MGYIYKITNSENGKVYVGQTTRTIPLRWKEHLRDTYYDKVDYVSYLHNAIKQYGEKAFVVEEIEECDDSLLDEREQYWIEQYNSCEDGYNINIGGQGTPKTSNKEILLLWNEGYPAHKIAKMLNLSTQTVAKRLKCQGIDKHEIFNRGNEAAIRGRKVIRISSDGKDIVLYNSLTEAAEANGLTVALICMVCNGNRSFSGGYRWKYYEGETLPNEYKPAIKKDRCRKKVYQYTLDGQYIRGFNSMLEAAKSLGKTGIRSINFACNSKRQYAYGFRWSREKYDTLPENKANTKSA